MVNLILQDKMEKQSQGKDYVEVTAPLVMTALDILLRCMLSYNDDIQQKGYWLINPFKFFFKLLTK